MNPQPLRCIFNVLNSGYTCIEDLGSGSRTIREGGGGWVGLVEGSKAMTVKSEGNDTWRI